MTAEIKTAAAGSIALVALALGALVFAIFSHYSIVSMTPPKAEAAGPTVIFLTSGTSWTVPSDWNSSNNTIEVIGGGGGGGAGGGGGGGAATGGGGGAYSKISNLPLTSGSNINYSVGIAGTAQTTYNGALIGGAGGDTWFNGANCSGSFACAKGGAGGAAETSNGALSGGAGGVAASGVGAIKYSGGNGGAVGGIIFANGCATGGGGAAGPNGNGNDGGNKSPKCFSGSGSSGGSGDAGFGGTGGGTGGHGGNGTEWDALHGSGGGGGGYAGTVAGSAGYYGAGGGGNRWSNQTQTSGAGAPGLIVITYIPLVATAPSAPQNLSAFGGISQISLTWSAPASDGGSPITTYKIYRSTSANPTTLYQTLGNVLSYTDTSVTIGTTYYYRVKATNAVGDSVYSNEANAVANASCPAGSNGGNISGWAWSDTIGWISLNSGDSGTCAGIHTYGLTLNADNTITGYAWSENVGWIQFGGLSGFPSGNGTTATNPQVVGNNIIGWARALAYNDPQAGGWDGWISLSGSGYGLAVINNTQITGYAWGDTNVGWIDFSANYACAQTYGYYCSGAVRHYKDISCNTDTIAGVPQTCSYLCSNGACVPPPNPLGNLDSNGTAIKITPSLVRPGGTATVTWATQNTTSCTVTENNPAINDSWTGTSGTKTTSPINGATTYSLDCIGYGGLTLHQTATVKNAASFREI